MVDWWGGGWGGGDRVRKARARKEADERARGRERGGGERLTEEESRGPDAGACSLHDSRSEI